MASTANNRRTAKTRSALKNVLVELLQTRSLQRISIREITERADISRGTFYLHYTDIFDLYQAIEKEVVEGITAIVNAKAPICDDDGIETMLSAIFEYLSDHMRECDALLRTDSASFLSQVFEHNKPSTKETGRLSSARTARARLFLCIYQPRICRHAQALDGLWQAGNAPADRQHRQKLLNSYMFLHASKPVRRRQEERQRQPVVSNPAPGKPADPKNRRCTAARCE